MVMCERRAGYVIDRGVASEEKGGEEEEEEGVFFSLERLLVESSRIVANWTVAAALM